MDVTAKQERVLKVLREQVNVAREMDGPPRALTVREIRDTLARHPDDKHISREAVDRRLAGLVRRSLVSVGSRAEGARLIRVFWLA